MGYDPTAGAGTGDLWASRAPWSPTQTMEMEQVYVTMVI
jgi:hypothetical protein